MSLIRKFFWALVVLLPAAILLVLAIANRHDVELVLDPLAPQDAALALELPLFLLVFAALAAGLLLGGFSTWLGQGKWRKRARDNAGEAARLRSEVARLNAQRESEEHARLPAPADGE